MQNIRYRIDQDGSYSILSMMITPNLSYQVIHARSGVPHEIMGLMQGKVMGDALIVMDSFALPVQGTETRVNAANEANEYMVEYIQNSEKVRFYL